MPADLSARPLILVADDDRDVLELVAYCLERAGYDVIMAADGVEALALARERHPDLAVLDVMMPKLDGYTLARALRAGSDTRQIPILLLSGRSGPSYFERCAEAGADLYLCKPFSPRDLRHRVETTLAAVA